MDVLTQFLTEFMKNAGPIGLVPFIDAPVVHRVEDVTSILWYRRGPFQVQLFAPRLTTSFRSIRILMWTASRCF